MFSLPFPFSRKSDRTCDIDKRSLLKPNLSSTTVKSNQFCSLWKFCFLQGCSIQSQHHLLVSLSTSLGGKPMLAGNPLTSAWFYRTIDDGHPECGEWAHALLQVGPLWAIRDLHSMPSAPHSPWNTYTGARCTSIIEIIEKWSLSRKSDPLACLLGVCHSSQGGAGGAVLSFSECFQSRTVQDC